MVDLSSDHESSPLRKWAGWPERNPDHKQAAAVLTPGPGDTFARAIAKAARAFDGSEPLEFIRHVGNDDAYRRGGALIVVPGIWAGMPAHLLDAVRARRACSVTGACPVCGACVDLARGTFAHEHRCPVSDERLVPVLNKVNDFGWVIAEPDDKAAGH